MKKTSYMFLLGLLFGGIFSGLVSNPHEFSYVSRQIPNEDRKRKAEILDSLGMVEETVNNNPKKALELYQQALTLMNEAQDTVTASTLENLGFVYNALSQYQEALRYHRRCLAMRQLLGRREDVAASLNAIGEVLQVLDDYETSTDTLSKALQMARELNIPEGEPVALLNISINYLYLGQYEKAVDSARTVINLARVIERQDIKASAATTVGMGYFYLRQYDSAATYYTRAIDICRSFDRKTLGLVYGNFGLVFNAKRKYRQAEHYIDSALAIALSVGDTLHEASALSKRGLVYLSSKQYKKAMTSLNEAALIFGTLHLPDRLGTAYTRLMRTSVALKRKQQAILFGKLAVNCFQAVRQRVRHMEPDVQKDYLLSKESAYRELADLLIQQRRIAEAQIVIRMLKEEEYREFIERDGDDRGALSTVSSMTDREDEFARQYAVLSESLIVLGRSQRELRGKVQRSHVEELQLERISSAITVANHAFRNFLDALEDSLRRQGSSPLPATQMRKTLGDLQEILKEYGRDAVIIQTVLTKNKYNVILVTPDLPKTYQFPLDENKFIRLVSAFQDSCRNPHTDPRKLGEQLYKILVKPLEKDLRAAKVTTLIWSPDGVMNYIPFAALYTGKQYLAEKYQNVTITLSSLLKLKDPVSPQWHALGLGVTKSIPPFPALQGVRDELYSIVRLDSLNPWNAVLWGTIKMNDEFTREALTSASQRYQVVHIASHFQFTPGNSRKSFLLLGDSSRLTLRDVQDLSLPFSGVELLTLSACNTAMGSQESNGREIENFGELAQQQGAQAVLASLWPVNDDVSTPYLMKNFYKLKGEQPRLSKAAALQKAQLMLLRGEDSLRVIAKSLVARGDTSNVAARTGSFHADQRAPFSHPYFWAPFVLIGNWR